MVKPIPIPIPIPMPIVKGLARKIADQAARNRKRKEAQQFSTRALAQVLWVRLKKERSQAAWELDRLCERKRAASPNENVARIDYLTHYAFRRWNLLDAAVTKLERIRIDIENAGCLQVNPITLEIPMLTEARNLDKEMDAQNEQEIADNRETYMAQRERARRAGVVTDTDEFEYRGFPFTWSDK